MFNDVENSVITVLQMKNTTFFLNKLNAKTNILRTKKNFNFLLLLIKSFYSFEVMLTENRIVLYGINTDILNSCPAVKF